jgi:hypothetical protein
MTGVDVVTIGAGVLSIIVLFVNVGYVAGAVGTIDQWENIQQPVNGFVVGGLMGTVVLIATAWLLALVMGPSASWGMSLILSIFAFGIAFGAVSMAAIKRR